MYGLSVSPELVSKVTDAVYACSSVTGWRSGVQAPPLDDIYSIVYFDAVRAKEVRAYVRTEDGFLTAMHDLMPASEHGSPSADSTTAESLRGALCRSLFRPASRAR